MNLAHRDIKQEIIQVLTPIFGHSSIKIIEDNYDSEKPEELIKLARHMLSGYMGEKNAEKILHKITRGYK